LVFPEVASTISSILVHAIRADTSAAALLDHKAGAGGLPIVCT
jgi:hypothetical protein